MLSVSGLSKQYGHGRSKITALSGLDLSVERGQAVALMGPNGAGKSTVVGILSTLVRPDSGRALVAGFDVTRRPQRVREMLGVVRQDTTLYPAGRVRQVLTLHARLLGLTHAAATGRADELIELVRLQDVADRKIRRLSGGMRRRLDIGLSLVSRPPVLLLDEPTHSLDPVSRHEILNELGRLRDDGTCILFASQDLEETERLADWVGYLDGGTLQSITPASKARELCRVDETLVTR